MPATFCGEVNRRGMRGGVASSEAALPSAPAGPTSARASCDAAVSFTTVCRGSWVLLPAEAMMIAEMIAATSVGQMKMIFG